MKTRRANSNFSFSHSESDVTGRKNSSKRVTWNLEEEIAKVIERGVEMEIDFQARSLVDTTVGLVKAGDEDVNPQIDPWTVWNLEDEVAKVVETGAALGFDFNGNEEEIALVVSSIEREDEARQSNKGRVVRFPETGKIESFYGVLESSSFGGTRLKIKIQGQVVARGRQEYKNVWWRRPTAGLPLNKLSIIENASLEEKFSKDEVLEALRGCDGNKAPRPNEFNIKFIKDNWDVIEGDFMKLMEEFYREGSIVKKLNKTVIALIPKYVKPKSMKDYRLISLVGSLYKILAKLLANRMSKVIVQFSDRGIANGFR
ncbi:hypothetical protein Dsin_001080 [Dipteronia sinensis]|uniref:Reverse transcriptase domain-containing protein n=1 Tax=Dipteronia sinensis TaxID=43782 RepID=A0AAE0B4P7_9ROSI|nr:hypothetical protein Dsin_001080 [Dipteronia sinensis]